MPGPEVAPPGFEVGPRIHRGGMADVYEVTGGEAGFPLVMKVPRIGHGEPAENVITFEMEQTILAALHGPHAPRLVAAGGLEAARPFLVMERIDGRSLREWVAEAPLPPEEVARLGAALATALHALHAQDCVHLDVKPSNVIVRRDGTAVLVDFGLAHHAHYPDLIAEERRGPLGSAPYVSPEAVRGVRSDPRSDVFSLGAVLYELATGRLAFGAPSSPAALRRRLYHDPEPPRAAVPACPAWLQEVILRCLEPDAAERYASAAQVAFELGHPEQVTITDRGLRARRTGLRTVVGRWLRAVGSEPEAPPRPSAHLASASIVLAALSPVALEGEPLDAMREVVRRVLAAGASTRLACVTVIPPIPLLGGPGEEDTATRQRLKHVVRLRHWAEPLRLEARQLSVHVLESDEPARTILEYARANHVDHIVMGAPPKPVPADLLGKVVSMQVAGAARCSVTLVRAEVSPGGGGGAPPAS
jgi:nucleotide-binding universal stress UspA family protein